MYSEKDLLISEKYIDKKATQEKAEDTLKSYPRMKRIARQDNTGLSSPRFDGMPKSHSVVNTVERRLVQSIYAKRVVKEIPAAIDACDEVSQKVLKLLYLRGWSPEKVEEEIHCSDSKFSHKVKPEALTQFAEAYMLDDLKVYHFPSKE